MREIPMNKGEKSVVAERPPFFLYCLPRDNKCPLNRAPGRHPLWFDLGSSSLIQLTSGLYPTPVVCLPKAEGGQIKSFGTIDIGDLGSGVNPPLPSLHLWGFKPCIHLCASGLPFDSNRHLESLSGHSRNPPISACNLYNCAQFVRPSNVWSFVFDGHKRRV